MYLFPYKEAGLAYQQRIFINEKYFSGSGPVFLYIGGEGATLSSSVRGGQSYTYIFINNYIIYPYYTN